jgi:hypothetical protein
MRKLSESLGRRTLGTTDGPACAIIVTVWRIDTRMASRLNNRQGLARALRRGVPFGNPLILLAAMSVGIDFREFSPDGRMRPPPPRSGSRAIGQAS